MAASVHPLADEWTDEYSLFVIEHDFAAYSRPLRHFLDECRASRVKPVLLTGPGVLISPHLYTAMVESGAHWAFRDEEGVFDARSGLRICAIPDLWQHSATTDRHTLIDVPGVATPTLLFDIYAGDRATDQTMIGPHPGFRTFPRPSGVTPCCRVSRACSRALLLTSGRGWP